MSQVRGKAPLKATFQIEVRTEAYSRRIVLKTGAWQGGERWYVQGELEVQCATRLVRELRKALREIRDVQTAYLAKAVTDAEGPL